MLSRSIGGAGRFRRILVGLALPALVAGGIVVASATARADVAEHGYGYAWTDQPSAPIGVPYVPNTGYQFNSTGAQNTATHTGTGQYVVRFPNIGATGMVTVTAYNGFFASPLLDNRCKVQSWFGTTGTTSPVDTLVNVACYSHAGALVDSMFTVNYTFPGTAMTKGGYLWNDQPSAPFGTAVTPSLTYQANSTRATNRLYHTATGQYEVIMPGLGHQIKVGGGQLLVGAYGSAVDPAAYCDAEGDLTDTSGAHFVIFCADRAGRAMDSSFVLTYVDHSNVMFAPTRTHPTATMEAACGEEFGGNCTLGSRNFDTNPAANVTISVVAPGQYAVKFPVSMSGGNVQIGEWFGIGNPPNSHCSIAFWNSTDGVRVTCVDIATGGVPTDASFALTIVT